MAATSGGGLAIGATVEIHGLQAVPEHNGVHGNIETWDQDKGRWGVRLKSTGKLLGLKPANLTPVQGPTDAQKFMVKRLQMLRDAGEWEEVVNLDSQARKVAETVRAAWPEGATAIYRYTYMMHDIFEYV
jgi:hypothetical protein